MTIDALIDAIAKKNNPTVLGLDTQLSYLPEDFLKAHCDGEIQDFGAAAAVIEAYNRALVDALADIVPAVKVQVAYYEMYGVPGMQAFYNTVEYASSKGLLVIADVKRNDIGATAGAYATAYLGNTELQNARARAFRPDFVTVTPYLGEDGVLPFVSACRESGRGIFVLVKTSNPSSGQLQDLMVDGQPIWRRMGKLVSEWGEGLIGKHKYSAVGAVVGATYPDQGRMLRKQLPHTFFLVPGYGAQGATAKDLAGCFDAKGGGAIVNASRSILCAWKKHTGTSFEEAAQRECRNMQQDINQAIGR